MLQFSVCSGRVRLTAGEDGLTDGLMAEDVMGTKTTKVVETRRGRRGNRKQRRAAVWTQYKPAVSVNRQKDGGRRRGEERDVQAKQPVTAASPLSGRRVCSSPVQRRRPVREVTVSVSPVTLRHQQGREQKRFHGDVSLSLSLCVHFLSGSTCWTTTSNSPDLMTIDLPDCHATFQTNHTASSK